MYELLLLCYLNPSLQQPQHTFFAVIEKLEYFSQLEMAKLGIQIIISLGNLLFLKIHRVDIAGMLLICRVLQWDTSFL
jgi:hypothetical protein